MTQPDTIPEFMDVRAVADRLNVSPLTVYKAIWEGRLRHVKISARCIRVRRQDFDDFVNRLSR